MFNYENIGNKIKGLAQMAFVVEAIAAVITGIALMASDEDLILYGLLVLIAGPIIAWVSSWLLYGFGELIEMSTVTAHATGNIESILRRPEKSSAESEPVTAKKTEVKELPKQYTPERIKEHVPNTVLDNGWWKCGNCGTENAPYCSSCACGNTKKQHPVQ